MATVTIWTEEDILVIDCVDGQPYKLNDGCNIVSLDGKRVDWFEEGSVKRIEYDATCEDEEPEQEGTTDTLKFYIDFSAAEIARVALESLALAAVEAERAVNSLSRTFGVAVGKDAW